MRKPSNRDRGWKLDPKDETRARFWNGMTWTQQLASTTPEEAAAFQAHERGERVDLPTPSNTAVLAATVREPTDQIVTIGWVTALLIPIVGFFVGLVALTRGHTEGVWVMITSVVAAVVWFFVLGDLFVAAS